MTATLTATLTATRSRRRDLALVAGVPLLWAVVLLLHPTGDPTEVFDVIQDEHSAWMFVHLTTVAFIPLMAVVVHHLLRGVESTPARISRWAMPAFITTYGAFEALMGLGTGIIVGSAHAADPARADLLQDFMDSGWIRLVEQLGTLSLGVMLVGAAFALRRAGRIGPWNVAAIFVAAAPISFHVPPFGQVGLVLFVAAVLPALGRPG
jgi:hypothetical protein